MKRDTVPLVLIIDDLAFARLRLREVLEELGFSRFVEASSGAEAMTLMYDQMRAGDPVGLVTCDMNMPGVGGIAFLKMARASQEFKDLIIIMVTAEAERSRVIKALSQGATDYLLKPYSLGDVRKKLANVIKSLSKTAKKRAS